MAEPVVIVNETFKRRNPLAVALGLPLITLGVYYFVWYYKINNEARRYLRDPSIRPGMSLLAITLGVFIIVPPFISIYGTAGRVRRMQENAQVPDRCEPWIALIFALLFRFFLFSLDALYLQIQLNKVWDAYLHPSAVPHGYPAPLPPPGAAMQTPPPPPLP